MAEEDDIPPLEDLSHAFRAHAAVSTAVPAQPSVKPSTPAESAASHVDQNSSSAAAPARTGAFCGMRRGFLKSQQPKPPISPAPAAAPGGGGGDGGGVPDYGVPYIRADPAAASRSLRLEEVQERIQAAESVASASSANWMTDDLLARVAASPSLVRRLGDPRMSAALDKFRADPAAAIREFKDDTEIQEFLGEFSALLGEHFSRIADLQEQSQPPPPQPQPPQPQPPPIDPEVADVLSRPGVREALTDAEVQRWMSLLKADPDRAQAVLRASRDPQFQGRVRTLFENGLIGLAK